MKPNIRFILPGAVLLTLFPLAGPLQACCDDPWSCFAAVATGGLTCAIESLVNLVKTLSENVARLIATLGQQASDVINLARTELVGAANDVRGIASQAENDFNAAAQAAASIVDEATRPAVVAVRPPMSPAGITSPSRAVPPGAAPAPVGGTPRSGLGTAVPVGGVAPVPKGGPSGSASVGTVARIDLPVDQQELLDALRRAKQVIDDLRPDVTAPLNQIRQFATNAEQQVASAVTSAAGIAESALLAPLKVLGNMLSGLVAHPERIFDPGRIVDDAITQVTNQVIATMTQVHDMVMGQAKATLDQAQKPLHDVLDRASVAKKIADAMQKLQRAKTKSACDALNGLAPRQRLDVHGMVAHVAGFTHASGITAVNLDQHKSMAAAPFSRFAASRLTAKTVGIQAGAKLKGPWQEFKRIQATPPKVDPSAQAKVDADLERRFAGKTPAEAAAEKRAMLAEARARFAKDPKTLQKVEALLESHRVIRGHVGPAGVQPPGVREQPPGPPTRGERPPGPPTREQ